MERLDQTYLNALIRKTKDGDSNAFAELYAAVSERQYTYLMYMLQDRAKAEEKLQEVFVQVLQTVNQLPGPELFMSWISRLSYRSCKEMPAQLVNLPLADAQILVMHTVQGLSLHETGELLNLGRRTVKRRIRTGRKHLMLETDDRERIERQAEEAQSHIPRRKQQGMSVRMREQELDIGTAARILEAVFDACGKEPNTEPIESLASYSVYRKERFSLQRGILAAAMALFLMLPAMFILPRYQIASEAEGVRGLPVYTVSVDRSILPVTRVTASMKQHSLPVYEAGNREFTIEPTRNGEMHIEVQLLNHQGLEQTCNVTEVDADGPVLEAAETKDDALYIHVNDTGIGVDYRGIYATGASGTIYRPQSADEKDGIVFRYPEEPWDIYIPDQIGNTLHLSVHFE